MKRNLLIAISLVALTSCAMTPEQSEQFARGMQVPGLLMMQQGMAQQPLPPPPLPTMTTTNCTMMGDFLQCTQNN
jgi:hypothetical protein